MNMKNDWFVKKKERFYFCYSEKQAYFLIEVKGITFITEALRTSDSKKFYLFERTEQLEAALKEYRKMKSPRWENLKEMKNKK
ncbi:hypothetical protein [Peribacillus sp. YIM B13477]|uniref:hypothetical protein n=1 Tax=Peribacillus sp. YIM B13477 TaxID=3366300 RepID=UPI00366E43D7